MRKILPQEEIAVKEKRKNKIISLALLGILLFSTAGFAFVSYQSDNTASVQGQSSVRDIGGRWAADLGNGQQLSFAVSPESANATKIYTLISLNDYYQKPLYIDTQSQVIYDEIASNLGRYTERVQYGCYSNCENSSYVEKDCTSNLIIVKPSENNKVYQNQTCVIIEGDIRAVDAFLYKTFGLA